MNLITINLDAADAVAIASLINATGGNVDNPEILNQVRLLIDGRGMITATGTNRFMIANYAAAAVSVSCNCAECLAGEPMPNFELGLTAAACKFIAANVKRGNKWATPEPVELIANLETRELSVRHGAAVIGDQWPAGKFPDVLSLLTDWQPAADAQPVKLRTAWLGVLGKLLDGYKKVDYWLYELGSDRLGRADKPGPVRATAGKFTALIQPNLIK